VGAPAPLRRPGNELSNLAFDLVRGRTAWRDPERVKLLVDGRLLKSTRLTRSFKVLSYASGMTVSSRAVGVLADALRVHRSHRATR
jgi:hypothetical protein